MPARMSCGEAVLEFLETVGLEVVAGAEEVVLVVEEAVEELLPWRFDGIFVRGTRGVGCKGV